LKGVDGILVAPGLETEELKVKVEAANMQEKIKFRYWEFVWNADYDY
jgi:hypothetical protein